MKDVSTSEVQNEEQTIFRAQEMDLIYAESGLLYEIIHNAPILVSTLRSNLDHMSIALLVVRVPNLQIRLLNRSVNYLSTNLPRDKPRLCLNPPKW